MAEKAVIRLLAYQLVAEVLDHAPADLSPAEVLVLTALADWSDAHTRECKRRPPPGKSLADELEARAHVSASGLRAAFMRLRKKGLDPRVPIGKKPNGDPIFAYKGRACSYVLPPLPVPAGCTCQSCHCNGATEVRNGDTTVRNAATPVRQRRHSSGTPSVSPESPTSRGRVREAQARQLGVTAAEVEQLIRSCPDCGGTGKREDANRNPTRERCHHEAVLGDAARPRDVFRQSGLPA